MPTEILGAAHIQQALALSAEAGWNQTADDWALFIAHGTLFGEIIDGGLVATAAALPYGEAFGWISMVLTTRAQRGRGLARRLTAAATATLRDRGRAALLDATPAGAAVYEKLGFVPLCTMQRWQGEGRAQRMPSGEPDLACDAFGADRSFLLDRFLARPGTQCFAAADSFAFLRAGAIAAQIGPVVGPVVNPVVGPVGGPPQDAAALVRAAIAAASGRVFIDVLQAGEGLLPMLADDGFTEQRSFTRMALGCPCLPGDAARLLVAASPEFG